ncbi:uncharacterized protein LOC142554601 [Primulina tabacum]|uniref:uncharacterized protein LOC142554601 n=1 Tax=Primulina tabacum TaxID=48773 RepID=UPI003F5A3199
MVESGRLTYIRMHQKQLRCEMYKGLHDALLHGETNASIQGRRIILPSSFTGGARYMIQNYQDAMAICKWASYPDLFMTFTCNPKWPEIVRFIEHYGLRAEDRPDIDGYPSYRRKDNGRTIIKNGVNLDNRFVVPHNRYLLIRYGAHMNVEWCNQSRAIEYLFKYINKGHDRVTASFYKSSDDDSLGKNVDEVNMYYDCRYISQCEAAWRIFGFEIQYRDPPVERLSFHLPNEQNIIFSDSDEIGTVLDRPTINQSMFLAWMETNKKYPKARELTYAELPMKFVWKQETREFVPRKQRFSIGRIFYVPPGCGEMYYLRCLLNVNRGATCYDDITFVNGVQYRSFRDACYALGLLNDDKEYIDGIIEASHWASAQSLRVLIATLLSSNCISRPEVVWESCWTYLSDDILYKRCNLLQHQELELNEDEIRSYALIDIEKLLQSYGKKDLCRKNYDKLINNLNSEQRRVYDTIMKAVVSNKGVEFFVYGYGGTGKTFVWKTLSAYLRSKGEIILNVASSGIASLLLPDGRTAHSRFAIPFNLNEESTCNKL